MNTLLIRPAILADIARIMDLVAEAPTAAQWPAEHYEQAIHNSRPRRVMLVLEEQTIQAFLVARAVADEWELENIAVAANARRKRLGSIIFEEFLQIVRNEEPRTIFLEMRESNTGGHHFYEKLRFQKAGRRPGYYDHPKEDAIVYRLDVC